MFPVMTVIMSFSMSDAIEGPRSKGGAPIGTVMEGDTRSLRRLGQGGGTGHAQDDKQ